MKLKPSLFRDGFFCAQTEGLYRVIYTQKSVRNRLMFPTDFCIIVFIEQRLISVCRANGASLRQFSPSLPHL